MHIHLKRELSHETRLLEINPTTKHMLFDIVSYQYHRVQLQTLAMDLCGDRSVKAATTAQVTVRYVGRLLQGESFIFLYINTLFPKLKELRCTGMDSQITADMVSSPDSLSDWCCLYASKHLLPNSPHCTNCS